MVLPLQFVRIHFTFNENNSIKAKTKKKKKFVHCAFMCGPLPLSAIGHLLCSTKAHFAGEMCCQCTSNGNNH